MLLRSIVLPSRFYSSTSKATSAISRAPNKKKSPANEKPEKSTISPEPVGKSWDIFVAVALIRPPVAAPPMSVVERRMAIVNEQLDEERSLKSDFELELVKETRQLEKRKKLLAQGLPLGELEDLLLNTWNQRLKKRAIKVDAIKKQYHLDNLRKHESQDLHSLQRMLDRKLILLVRQRFKATNKANYFSEWKLPQLKNNGEPLKETAEKCLKEVIASNLDAFVFGNAPISHYKYYYPKNLIRTHSLQSKGAYVFLYASQFDGSILQKLEMCDEIYDHRWCPPGEIKQLFVQKNEYEAISHMLFE